jgi:CxxC motif-containing protein
MKHITCITCPVGCRITVDTVDGEYVFTGGKCPKGAQFARTELTAPMRTLTTTVRTAFPAMPVLPVRTRGEVPKGTIPEIIRELSKLVITEKMGIGGIVAADILGTGTDIIATGNMLYKENNHE